MAVTLGARPAVIRLLMPYSATAMRRALHERRKVRRINARFIQLPGPDQRLKRAHNRPGGNKPREEDKEGNDKYVRRRQRAVERFALLPRSCVLVDANPEQDQRFVCPIFKQEIVVGQKSYTEGGIQLGYNSDGTLAFACCV